MQETRAQILDALADGPRTGPGLAEELDISRAAVWKHVEALREDGFDITSTDDGYELTAIPEFGAGAVSYGLDAPVTIEYHDAIPSTNERARELAAAGAENVVVLADEQTGGRGRLEREWSSPSGGIWLSVLTRPPEPAMHAPVFTLAAAVATVRALGPVGVDASIKWPNDLLVENDKLAGILTEMEGEADRIGWLVVGIGLNANIGAEDLPAGATSLLEEVGPVDRAALARDIIEEYWKLTEAPDTILPAWREHASTLGKQVRVETADGVIVGTATDVSFPGTLVVETKSGTEHVTTGDCEHLRPA